MKYGAVQDLAHQFLQLAGVYKKCPQLREEEGLYLVEKREGYLEFGCHCQLSVSAFIYNLHCLLILVQ